MNKKLPYEEELSKQLNDLPLPNEDVSWEDMKRRLDEDKDDGIIIPPLQKGCLRYSFLLILLAAVLWIVSHPGNWPWHKNKQESFLPVKALNDKDHAPVGGIRADSIKKYQGEVRLITPEKNIDSAAIQHKGNLSKGLLKGNNEMPENEIGKPEASETHKAPPKKIIGNYAIKNKDVYKHNKKTAGSLHSEIAGNEQNADSSKSRDGNINESQETISTKEDIKIDSIAKQIADTPSTDTNTIHKKIKAAGDQTSTAKKDSSVKKIIYFAAGAGLHQQLPVNGQNLVPYHSLGRKSTLGDYIPSIHLRMYRDKKWFLESEFRYGAPQYTKEILYVQKKIVDTFTRSTLDTSSRLKKTYYHQLPVSFNYFVLPHFSVGLGLTWNRFSSAVSEQKVTRINNLTLVDSVITKTIFHPKKADSNFVKSYFQAFIETQYQWKRWSFGARYSFGLQPYLKFQLPGGQHREEKNSSLGIFIKYNLWESKKK